MIAIRGVCWHTETSARKRLDFRRKPPTAQWEMIKTLGIHSSMLTSFQETEMKGSLCAKARGRARLYYVWQLKRFSKKTANPTINRELPENRLQSSESVLSDTHAWSNAIRFTAHLAHNTNGSYRKPIANTMSAALLFSHMPGLALFPPLVAVLVGGC